MKKTTFRNEDVKRVLVGVPKSRQHMRTVIETVDEQYIFQEATIASIVRAYISLKTHPTLSG